MANNSALRLPASPTFLLLLLLLLPLATLFLPSTGARPSPSPSSHLVNTTCAATLYRDLCHQSMSPLPPSVARNATQLARAAVSLSLDSAQRAAARLAKLPAGGALQDCADTMGDCVDLLLQCVGELGRPGGSDPRGRVTNVQTWASAALVDARTCLNSLHESQLARHVLEAVKEKVTRTSQMTSNALVFVNAIAPKD